MIKKRNGCVEILPFIMIIYIVTIVLIFTSAIVKKERTKNLEHQTIKMIADDIKINEKLFSIEINENELIIRRRKKVVNNDSTY